MFFNELRIVVRNFVGIFAAAFLFQTPSMAEDAARQINRCIASDFLPLLQKLALERIPENELSYNTLFRLRLMDRAEQVAEAYQVWFESLPTRKDDPDYYERIQGDALLLKRHRLMQGFLAGSTRWHEVLEFVANNRNDFRTIQRVTALHELSSESVVSIGKLLIATGELETKSRDMLVGVSNLGLIFQKAIETQSEFAQLGLQERASLLSALALQGFVSEANSRAALLASELTSTKGDLYKGVAGTIAWQGRRFSNGSLIDAYEGYEWKPDPPDPNMDGLDLGESHRDPNEDWHNRWKFTADQLSKLEPLSRRYDILSYLVFEAIGHNDDSLVFKALERVTHHPMSAQAAGRLFAYHPNGFEEMQRFTNNLTRESSANSWFAFMEFSLRAKKRPAKRAWAALIEAISNLSYETYRQTRSLSGGGIQIQLRPNIFENLLGQTAQLLLTECD